MNERGLTAKVKKRLRERGAWALKVHGGPHQRAGVPDFLICYRGFFIAVELKSPEEPRPEPSPLQRIELAAIERAGGLASLCVTVECVDRLLDRVDASLARLGVEG